MTGKPNICQKPKNKEAKEGEQVTFDFAVKGTPPLQLTVLKGKEQWEPSDGRCKIYQEEDGKEIKFFVTIDKCQVDDAGLIKFDVKNSKGEDSCDAKLTVHTVPKAPDFIEKFDKQIQLIADNDKNIKLSCRVTGNPAPDVKWFKDNIKMIHTGNVTLMKEDNVCTLEVEHINQENSGQYKCELTNTAGTAVCITNINVAERSQFTLKPKSEVVKEGDTVKFDCKVQGNPLPEITLYKGNALWEPTLCDRFSLIKERVNEEIEFSLVIDKCQVWDSGCLEFRATNIAGEDKCHVDLNVLSPPVFTKTLKDQVITDTFFKLNCCISGRNIDVEWLKDDIPLKESNGIRMSRDGMECTLEVKCIADAPGLYSCLITNIAGTALCNAYITVAKTPRFILKPTSEDVKEGATVKFVAKIEGNPLPEITPEITLLKNNEPWKQTDGRFMIIKQRMDHQLDLFLSIDKCQVGDSCNIKLKVENSAGQDSCEATLNVQSTGFMEKHGYILTMLILCQVLTLFNYMYFFHVDSHRVPDDSTPECTSCDKFNSKMDQLRSELTDKVDKLRFDLKGMQLKLNQSSNSDQTPDSTAENLQQELETLRSKISEVDKDIQQISSDLQKEVQELKQEKADTVQTNDRLKNVTDQISSLETATVKLYKLYRSFESNITGAYQKLDVYDEKLEHYDEELGKTGSAVFYIAIMVALSAVIVFIIWRSSSTVPQTNATSDVGLQRPASQVNSNKNTKPTTTHSRVSRVHIDIVVVAFNEDTLKRAKEILDNELPQPAGFLYITGDDDWKQMPVCKVYIVFVDCGSRNTLLEQKNRGEGSLRCDTVEKAIESGGRVLLIGFGHSASRDISDLYDTDLHVAGHDVVNNLAQQDLFFSMHRDMNDQQLERLQQVIRI